MTEIACTLPLERVPDRLALIGRLADDGLLDSRPIRGGLRYRFRGGDDIERRVREVVALESRCCAFLTFAVGRDGDAVALDITGPDEALPVIEGVFAFTARTRATARPG